MAKYTFLSLAEEVLKGSKTALAPSVIWKKAEESGLVEKLKIKGKTPQVTLSSQLYADTKNNHSSKFIRLGERPALFGLKGVHSEESDFSGDGVPEVEAEDVNLEFKIKERDLHRFLAYYAYRYMRWVYVKTIYHEKSIKKGYAEWVHPDLVGVRFPFSESEPGLKRDMIEFVQSIASVPITLFSFELKVRLNFSNLRESFFQAVSNSSWAHQGYLVAAEVEDDLVFRDELGKLSNAFGIGVIRLDINNPDDSEVIFQAKEREDLNWDFIESLSFRNKDFRDFLNAVKDDSKLEEPRAAKYDRIEEDSDKLKIKAGSGIKK